MATGIEIKHLAEFIIEAGKITFSTADGHCWRMRQPTPDEAASGDSAYRLAYRQVMDDKRLANLAGSPAELEREARIRASAAQAIYLLPLLLEKPGMLAGEWVPAFDPFSDVSMAEFEALDGAVIAEMVTVYWGPIQEAASQAKKKSPSVS
jgi:hypothetical protein